MEFRLRQQNIEDLRNIARMSGLKGYSYEDLLVDFLVRNLPKNILEEELNELEGFWMSLNADLDRRPTQYLRQMAKERKIKGYSNMNRQDLIRKIVQSINEEKTGRALYVEKANLRRPKSTVRTKKGARKTRKEELSKLRVVDLKDILRNKGLKVSGNKAVLVERILKSEK